MLDSCCFYIVFVLILIPKKTHELYLCSWLHLIKANRYHDLLVYAKLAKMKHFILHLLRITLVVFISFLCHQLKLNKCLFCCSRHRPVSTVHAIFKVAHTVSRRIDTATLYHSTAMLWYNMKHQLLLSKMQLFSWWNTLPWKWSNFESRSEKLV